MPPMPQPSSLVNTDDIMDRLNTIEHNMNNTLLSVQKLDVLESNLNELKTMQNTETVSPLPEIDVLNTKLSTLEAKFIELQTPTNDVELKNNLNILEESSVTFQHNMNEKVQAISDNLNELNLFKTDETAVLKNKFEQYDSRFTDANNMINEKTNDLSDKFNELVEKFTNLLNRVQLLEESKAAPAPQEPEVEVENVPE
jgi:predicted  nucleic acid-binding Zn-ribbon protein